MPAKFHSQAGASLNASPLSLLMRAESLPLVHKLREAAG